MSSLMWQPATETNRFEKFLLSRLHRTRKLFGFLRLYRHQLFDETFQQELCSMYRNTGAGKPPCPPALLAMALLLQGYLKVSDAEAVELTVVDLRWQLCLDCLGSQEPAFAQGTLADFRGRLIAHDMDLRLLERTVALAKSTGAFDAKKLPTSLRVAVDSSPLAGAGRVEDSVNLLAHAARKLVVAVAAAQKWDKKELAQRAGLWLLLGKSPKAALDIDWTQPNAKEEAIERLVEQLEELVSFVYLHAAAATAEPEVSEAMSTLKQLILQDLEQKEGKETLQLVDGVAPERRISIEDAQMRHGRKSSNQRIDGYKRHIATDLDTRLILACALTPANRPEAEAAPQLQADLARQDAKVFELYVDRAYLESTLAKDTVQQGGQLYCRPWVSRNGELYRKEDFVLDLEQQRLTCPAGQSIPIRLGSIAQFEAGLCQVCENRSRCTDAKQGGRSVRIAENEPLQQQLRQLQSSTQGRAQLRERVGVEHRLAHIGYRQGDRARYLGVRKNLYDLRRSSSLENLQILQHELHPPPAARRAA